MIRQANKYDKTEVIEMMKEFYKELQFETQIALDDEQHWDQLYASIIHGRGVIFIEQNVGLVMAVITPTIWCTKTLVLNCLAWVVKPQHRNKTIAYRLITKYIEYAEQLKKDGRIKYYTLGKTPKTPNIDYTKLGFRKTDETWVR